MPIHDQGYRRYGGATRATRHGRGRVIARAGIRTMFAQAGVSRAAAAVVAAVFRPRGADLRRRATSRRRRSSRRRRETFRQFLEQQQIFVFFITVYVGAGLIANDRRANALQIYLSKPLTRAEYIFGKLAILMTFLLLVTWVPAIVLLDRADRRSPATSRSSGTTCSCSRRSRSSRFIQVTMVVDGDAGAVVALEQQPLRRHPRTPR